MAGNKMSMKAKGRDDRSKGNKGQPSEEAEEFDYAQLRKPIKTSITGFAQARKVFDFATEELKDLLSNECDLLYECKVCRNIFRSLVNFVSHKRVYCKEKFNSLAHGHFIKNSSLVNELQRLKHIEESYQEAIKEKENLDKEDDERIPLTKDLSAIIERMTKNRGVLDRDNEVEQVSLQKIPNSGVAVFQSVNLSEEEMTDNMRSQVSELDHLLAQDKAVLERDGAFRIESSRESEDSQDPEGVIQISDDDDLDSGDVLKCKICNLQFSTQKTLKFHIKYKHLASRLVYPCPDCVDIFSTSWSVYRHLFKVHRKSAAQIRRLRESIQAKAFRMNNPPASYERRKNNMKPAPDKKITEEERLDQENQAWMDNMESDGAAPRCGGCGRSFERRAALAAHTQTCQPRNRALAVPRRPPQAQPAAEPVRCDPVLPRRTTTDPRRIEIQIRKDYNKGPAKTVDTNGNKLPQDENAQSSFKTDKEPETKDLEEATMFVVNNNEAADDKDSIQSESPEKSNDSLISAQTAPKAVSKPVIEPTESPAPKPQMESLIVPKSLSKPFVEQAEKVGSNLLALKQKIHSSPDVDMPKLICKRCDLKHRNIQELCDHMATHYKWLRYACKLCNHKNYNFDNLSEHVKTVHKLKGDSDFYHSTVKALDGPEALELLSEKCEEATEGNDTSPNSRRPSRCSSDSSRLSDDSNSSNARVETVGRKRRIGLGKGSAKRKKEVPEKNETAEAQKESDVTIDKVIHHVIFGDSDICNSNGKPFEENSSDLEDLEDKLAKRVAGDGLPKLVSRRPVRKRTRPKYEDFEYDLSNLLKMEAQGYRESQGVVTVKPPPIKKKPTPETPPQSVVTYEINKDFMCALLAMSKKSIELSAAHMRPTNMNVFKTHLEPRANQYPFAKPLLPKTQTKGDKASPKKEVTEIRLEKESPEKTEKTNNTDAPVCPKKVVTDTEANPSVLEQKKEEPAEPKIIEKLVKITGDRRPSKDASEKPGTDYISAVLPVKFRRQSLDVIKPLINKKITDFSKSGMKTKILVIKPINRKDGVQTLSSAMKFQTIKLKDPLKANESKTDQVRVVQVPKVDCTSANAPNNKDPAPTDSSEMTHINGESVDVKTVETPEVLDDSATEARVELMEVVDRIEPECDKDYIQEEIVDKT